MYTEESINEVKQAAKVVEVVGDYVELKKLGVNVGGLCPFHDEKTPSLRVSASKNIYKCFGCGKAGDPIEFLIQHKHMSYIEAVQTLAVKYNISLVKTEDHVYVKPTWKNKTSIHPKIVKWFEDRKISQETLIKAKVTDGIEWMPKANKEVPTIQFNYFRNDELVNIKYRDSNKDFKLHKGAELILYNIDSAKGKKWLYWVEGEVDALSLIEAGFVNDESGVVSVPNGAGKQKNNLSYIDNCWKDIEHIEQHYIAVDDDGPGRLLREEIANRLGKDKCVFITWLGQKDANDVLKLHGIQGVIDCCANKQSFPIEGAFTISDISNDIDDMYVNGLDKGIDLQIPDFKLNIVSGYLTIVTGIPSHGKSGWVDYMIINSIRFSNWKGAFYSPENRPTQLHFSKLARQLIGKHWDGPHRMTIEEKLTAKNFLEKKVWFIKPEKDFTLSSILNHVKQLIIAYGINFFVIDAWNKLDHKENDTHYIGRALDQLVEFCALNKVHCFLVAHPTKIEKDKRSGEYQIPTLYNISGSSNFFNMADNGLCVYRDFKFDESNKFISSTTKVFRQKIKFDHWGDFGHSAYHFHLPSLRYYKEGSPDFRNWITGEFNTIDKPLSSKEQDLQHQIYFEDDGDIPPF